MWLLLQVVSLRRGVTAAIGFHGMALSRFSVPRRAVVIVAALPSTGTISLRITAALAGCSVSTSLHTWASTRNLTDIAAQEQRSVVWEPLPWSGTQEEESPDLSELIEDLTSLSGWKVPGLRWSMHHSRVAHYT